MTGGLLDNSFINLPRGGIIKGTVEDEPLADRQVATIASPVHGSGAVIVRLGDVSATLCCGVSSSVSGVVGPMASFISCWRAALGGLG